MNLKSSIKKATFLSILFSVSSISAQEQLKPVNNPPVSTEFLISNRGVAFQMTTIKKLQSVPQLGFFGVTNILGEWDNKSIRDYMIQANVSYQMVKGVDVIAGFQATPPGGFRPSAGIIYSYAKPDLLFVVNPRIDLTKNGTFETFSLVEYRPKINDNWSYYSRLQGVYVQTTDFEHHARSYIMARLGVIYKDINFGLGTNLDWYGPAKKYYGSVGVFVGAALF
ncbi:hypothetical protein ACI76Y_09945 [Capnocytophaga cynodegmi]|uniref:hypothetical protein n=1 Tax=Capnocytophaga cynodegmi TaxID=28189 RepID=UPI00385A75F0